MKKICIIEVIYDDPLCIAQYGKTKSFYERQQGVTVVSLGAKHPATITPTTNDKETVVKWYEMCKQQAYPQGYDCYIRATPSTLLNIGSIVNFINSKWYDPNVVYTGAMYKQLVDDEEPKYFPRGNFVLMSNQMMNEQHFACKCNSLRTLMNQGGGINDDHLIGVCLCTLYKHPFSTLGRMMALDESDVDPFMVNELYKTSCVVYKCFGMERGADPRYQMAVLEMLITLISSHILPTRELEIGDGEISARRNTWRCTRDWLRQIYTEHDLP